MDLQSVTFRSGLPDGNGLDQGPDTQGNTTMMRDDINNAVKEAMKAKEERKLSTLRMVNATFKYSDI